MSRLVALPDGNAHDLEIEKLPPYTVAVYPAGGDGVTVYFNIGSGNWYPWDAGQVTTPTIRVVRGQLRQVRFQRTNGTGVLSVGEIL